jgi:methylmalonyl-CoA mutase
MASTGFLSAFPPVPTEEWDSAIRASVAGRDYPAKLIWHPEEGLAVRPYYRAEDIRDLGFLESAPGEFPYVRGAHATGDWRIREEIEAANPEEANRLAIEAIAAGTGEIAFCGARIESPSDVALMVANLSGVPVRFHGMSHQSTRMAADWFSALQKGGEVSADVDPLAHPEFSAELLCASMPGLRMFTISAENYEEKGFGAIEQIAFTLSAAVEFLDSMLERGVSIPRATGGLCFSFAIGPGFFVEIAKLRAFRLAWARVVESFKGDALDAKATIYARTAHWNETVYDPHVNILRTTMEAMSAILGGAESLSVNPFDNCYRRPDEASRRLARNVQLILKREACLARVADPLGGAYVIEAMTNTIAIQAWKLFQEIEAAGGYHKTKADGVIQTALDRRAAERDKSASHRRLVLTGTSHFANPSEKALSPIDIHCVDRGERVARSFEEMRFRTERKAISGNLPKIVLAEFGDAKMRGARAQFTADFLACVGLPAQIRCVESPIDLTATDADLIVLCSSDSEYLPFAEALMLMLKKDGPGPIVAVAGSPDNREELESLGIAEFIHLRSDAIEVLTRLQRKLGIED